jgi:hypothetical protein
MMNGYMKESTIDSKMMSLIVDELAADSTTVIAVPFDVFDHAVWKVGIR